MSFNCNYCGSSQTTKANLDRHQLSKKCISIQEANGHHVDTKESKCEFCKKNMRLDNLKKHYEVCILKPTNITNNGITTTNTISVGDNNSGDISVVNNITLDFGKFFTDQRISEIFQDYKSEHAIEHMKGLAKFVIEKILLLDDSPGYFVRDAMRNIYAFETENGIETDQNGELLRKKIKDGAGSHINGLVDKLINQYSVLTGKKNENKVEDMKDFKKEIKELNTTPKLVNCIKKSYTCKNKEQRNERILKIQDSKTKEENEKNEIEKNKKLEADRQRKIKLYKFNLDKDRPNVVLSKNQNDPLEYSDKPKLDELGLKAGDMFLEDMMA
jgi:hypothetical protein